MSNQKSETEEQAPEDRERTMQERIPDEAQTLDAQETLKGGERETGDFSEGGDEGSTGTVDEGEKADS